MHLFSKAVALSGGVVIDVTDVDQYDPQTWLDYHGVSVTDGKATVYKAVDADLNAGQGYRLTKYPIGGTVTAARLEAVEGLRLRAALRLPAPHREAVLQRQRPQPRFLECLIDVASFVALGDKCKAESVTVVREVTVDGEAVSA
jgi:hypothetical protein